ncbi:Smr/MutS family protein [Psychroserpens algicola]|uniref:DNA mismatch repair protein MutS n=1 Tax=Psychroserpens algicola TaxID=1719034 RepID=A0ABT0H6A8_9FLAO|nr:Smr/MutS family protein [Psychroserpens algicola]MCK8479895.1 DNA mismatch repair protein MutS [Psychroserpens algicola]
MSFKIGDTVSVLDDDITGVVTKISDNNLTIETSDGFEMEFSISEVIKAKSFSSNVFMNTDLNTVISEKEQFQKRKSVKIKPKERHLPAMEVDLHIHQITTSNKHMNNYDMLNLQLDTARHKLEFAIKKRIQKVVFIHGVGEGVLKAELEYLFGRYDNVKFYPADYQKYGLGATEVYIYQNTNP